MSHDQSSNWVDRRVRSAMQADIDSLQAAIEALSNTIAAHRDADRREAAESHEAQRLENAARMETERAETAARWEKDQTELAAVRGEVEHALAELSDFRAAMSAQVTETRGEVARIEQELRDAVGEAFRIASAEPEPDGRIEPLRVRVEGFVAQHRWDMDQLRQSLAAMAEHFLRGDDPSKGRQKPKRNDQQAQESSVAGTSSVETKA